MYPQTINICLIINHCTLFEYTRLFTVMYITQVKKTYILKLHEMILNHLKENNTFSLPPFKIISPHI